MVLIPVAGGNTTARPGGVEGADGAATSIFMESSTKGAPACHPQTSDVVTPTLGSQGTGIAVLGRRVMTPKGGGMGMTLIEAMKECVGLPLEHLPDQLLLVPVDDGWY
ncbi:hypothetical protein NHX12_029990 [Muraenolepis orangiensis]|uniref:Uncharacterized protein n=1 Tax=Muraenolepis orangiensis TaxID=630683 RepID=A0A9Q0IMD6_9TELE|nr:hypothetical protein NHX12_029990 [Muraenolepis orangiensis]